jgi:hypothetical protein
LGTLSTDSIAPKHQKELAQLRRSRGRSVRRIIIGSVALFLFFGIVSFLSSDTDTGHQGINAARKTLLVNGFSWAPDLITKQENYSAWLSSHGLGIEIRAFEKISYGLLHTASYAGSVQGTPLIGPLYVGLHFGFLRIAFLIISCWRLWAFVLLASAASVAWAKRLHTGRDMLGVWML